MADITAGADRYQIAGRIERLPFSRWHFKMGAIVSTGWFFDGFDALAIAYVLPVLEAQWHMSFATGFTLISAGYGGQLVGSILFGWLGERSLIDDGGGPNGAVAGLIKLAWSTLGQSFAEYTAEVDGLAAIAGGEMRNGRRLVASRSNTIAGGTTEVMKNIIGERSLGLPREPKV